MKILIVGATGMVGQSALREALFADDVAQVMTFGRTPVAQQDRKLRQVIAPDLFHADSELAALRNLDACFFCLGVSVGGMNEADYRRLTYDLTLHIAQALLPHNPQMRFVYISGAGTDSTEQGKTMWARVRGATENALLRLPFQAVYCFRPALIQPLHGVQSKTGTYRWFYRLIRPFFPLLRAMRRKVITSEQLGQAMLNAVRLGHPAGVLEAGDIRTLAEQRRG